MALSLRLVGLGQCIGRVVTLIGLTVRIRIATVLPMLPVLPILGRRTAG
jgi:hypothetical protein